MRKQEDILVSLNVSRHVSLMMGNACSFALKNFSLTSEKTSVCKYDNYIVVALQALGKQPNTELCTLSFLSQHQIEFVVFVLLICKLTDRAVFQLLTEGCSSD